jgi:Protein of unknown function (DUF1353)
MIRSTQAVLILWLTTLCAPLASAAVALILQPINPPALKPFADNMQWVLLEDINYHIGDSSLVITVPKGFVTDFASIPRAFWSFGLSPNGRYSKAAIIHDYLYWTQGCSRKQSDNILMIAMKESQVPASTRSTIYDGVRVGGGGAWKSNAGERKSGVPHVIPDSAMQFGPNVLWQDYKVKLQMDGIHDPQFPANPSYCAVGNSIDVPGRDK